MSAYYQGGRARSYDQRWHHFTQHTLSETLALIDVEAIAHHAQAHQRAPRLLDVACGTGVLLSLLHERFPDAELFGIDGSQDMLLQAHHRLWAVASLRLEHAVIGSGEPTEFPFPPNSFDLITCTNALHNLADPIKTIASLRLLLAREGHLVMEDYARRSPAIRLQYRRVAGASHRRESGAGLDACRSRAAL
jgi:ubiquinone/menaquinone biosynthesis C-methylase UbiE